MPQDKKPNNFGLALAAKRGDIKPEALQGAAKMLYQNFTEEQLAHYVREIDNREARFIKGNPQYKRQVRSF